MNQFDRIVLKIAYPEWKLEAGDIGTIVEIYKDGEAYEVEFMVGSGDTLAVLTLESKQVRKIGEKEILHVRNSAA